MASKSEVPDRGETASKPEISPDAVDAGAEVKPHTTHLVAWDVPSAIVTGEQFRMKVGVKCSSECDLTNRTFDVYDHDGIRVATGTLTGDRWPGTTALHAAEAELQAPAAEGFYTWSVKYPSTEARQESEEGMPHAEGAVTFGINVVSDPEYVVTVEAVDRESHTPLNGARVVMHPYRTATDERGVATMRVAKGVYKLFVSQSKYITLGMPIDVETDVTTRAELDLEPVLERN